MDEIALIAGFGCNIVILLGIIWNLSSRLATIETNIRWLMESEQRRVRVQSA